MNDSIETWIIVVGILAAISAAAILSRREPWRPWWWRDAHETEDAAVSTPTPMPEPLVCVRHERGHLIVVVTIPLAGIDALA